MIFSQCHRINLNYRSFYGTNPQNSMTLFRKGRNELKTLCRRYCRNEYADTSLASHPYCIPPFTNYVELTDLLIKNVVHKNKGLLILNRPQGLKKVDIAPERGFWLKSIKLTLPPSLQAVEKLSFTGVLPYLKKALGVRHVQLLKAPDRYMSGIAILSYHKKDVSKKVLSALHPPHMPKYTYLAVCEGIPFVESNSVRLGLTMSERNSSKKVMFVQKFSKRSVSDGKVYPFTIKHEILSTNDKLKVSLVELECTKNKWNGLRAYCAMRLLSPALGDSLFGCYVQEMQKTRIAVDPYSPAANKPYKIPVPVLEAVGLNSRQQSVVPLHIHLSKLNFLSYKADRRIFTAKPPDHFCWTCEKLGLTIPEEYLENRVSSRLKPKSDETLEGETIDSELDDDNEGESFAPIEISGQRTVTNFEEIQLDFDNSQTSPKR